jgi:hypothetical protein
LEVYAKDDINGISEVKHIGAVNELARDPKQIGALLLCLLRDFRMIRVGGQVGAAGWRRSRSNEIADFTHVEARTDWWYPSMSSWLWASSISADDVATAMTRS